MKIHINLLFRWLLLVAVIIYLPSCARKAASAGNQGSEGSSPSSRDPGKKREIFDAPPQAKKRTSKNKSAFGFHEDKVKEYEARVKANAKRDEKMAKEMEKPQYSDPTYFGHKKKPKKRPVGKRKLCKECGIVH